MPSNKGVQRTAGAQGGGAKLCVFSPATAADARALASWWMGPKSGCFRK